MHGDTRWQVQLEHHGAGAPELIVRLEAGPHRVKLSMSMEEARAFAATIAGLSACEPRPTLPLRRQRANAGP
jgi:hypothetical protein